MTWLLALIIGLSSVEAANLPVNPAIGPEGQADLRIFSNVGRVSLYWEWRNRWELSNRRYQALTLGSYFRVVRHLKVGAFFRRQYGARWDQDWVDNGTKFAWIDSRQRGENVLVLDATPRVELPFLPGEGWVANLKARYHYNFTHSLQTLTLRPGLNYFWMRNDELFLNLFAQWELYFPLNYGVKTIYESWAYTGFLYPFTSGVMAGFFGSYRTTTWGNTEEFARTQGQAFETTARSFVAGAILEFRAGDS